MELQERASWWWARRRASDGRSRCSSEPGAPGSWSPPAGPTGWMTRWPTSVAVASSAVCDVRDPAQCDAVVATAVERLGGLDAVVYATAVDPLVRLVDTDLERWRAVSTRPTCSGRRW